MNPLAIKALAIGAVVAALFVGWQFDRAAQFRAGKAEEKAAAAERANELLKKLESDNAEIGNMSMRDKCAELGFDWLPDAGCVD